jgi:hypothetical protein
LVQFAASVAIVSCPGGPKVQTVCRTRLLSINMRANRIYRSLVARIPALPHLITFYPKHLAPELLSRF